MTNCYRVPGPEQTRVELIRDTSDSLREIPELRRAGLGARNAAAAEIVAVMLLSVERDGGKA